MLPDVVEVAVDDADTILSVYICVVEFVPPSFTPIAKVVAPAVVGVPVIVAVVLLMPVLRLRPDGSVPEAIAQLRNVLVGIPVVEAISVWL